MSDESENLDELPRVDLRIPGPWETPDEFLRALELVTSDYRLDGDAFVHKPTGRQFYFTVSPPDDQMADVFAGGDRIAPEDIDAIAAHKVKIHLCAPGGSVEAVRALMRAAAAVIHAGGTGVMVDNSGAVHDRRDWLDLANDPQDGGMYWACVVVTASEGLLFSTGMHCLGFRDAEMPAPGAEDDREAAGFFLHNFLGYCMQSGATIADGDPLGDETTTMFHVRSKPCSRFATGTPFHNPYGVWSLEPQDDSDDD